MRPDGGRKPAAARPGCQAGRPKLTYHLAGSRTLSEVSRGMIEPTELVLSGWPQTDAEWSRLIDDNSIPPATVRRAVVFDFADPLLGQLTLPASTIASDGRPAERHPDVVTFHDLTCPEC